MPWRSRPRSGTAGNSSPYILWRLQRSGPIGRWTGCCARLLAGRSRQRPATARILLRARRSCGMLRRGRQGDPADMAYARPPVISPLHPLVLPVPFSGCWLWTGYLNPVNGYAHVTVQAGDDRTKTVYLHRIAYEQAKGAIPEELEIDHLCRVRCCVNPDHLEAVTHQINRRRGIQGMADSIRRVDIVGQRFGSLVVLQSAGRNWRRVALWECRCDCGNVYICEGTELRRGRITSCGCRIR